MFSLWNELIKFKNSIFKDKPSPAKSKKSIKAFLNYISQILNHFYNLPIKRTPKLTPQKMMCKGSMTVEASFLIPLLLFFVFHLFGVVEMIRLRSNITYSLWRVGKLLSIGEMAIEIEEDNLGIWNDLMQNIGGSLALSSGLRTILGEEYLESSPLVHGAKGLNFFSSEYCDEEGCIDIVVTYQVKPSFSIFPFPYTRMANRYYAKSFTGYDVAKSSDMVYVAEHGSVWHKSAECSYIHVKVYALEHERIGSASNAQGEIYSLCELCEDEQPGNVVYITEKGDRYHHLRDCSALRRHVRALQIVEVSALSPCSKCAKEEKE